jgi:hypothetical protein
LTLADGSLFTDGITHGLDQGATNTCWPAMDQGWSCA